MGMAGNCGADARRLARRLAHALPRARAAMRTAEPVTVRRLKVLRQIAYAEDGLRLTEVRGFNDRSVSDYLRALVEAGWVERVALHPGASTSHRPKCKFVVTAAGRAELMRATI